MCDIKVIKGVFVTLLMMVVVSARAQENDEQLLRNWIKVIAADEFGGRKPMTPYEEKAVKYLAQPKAPRRSVLFLFPSSEESGLFGSEYYCNHPAIAMEKTAACLNFESIGPSEYTQDVTILGGGENDVKPEWYHKPSDEYRDDWDLSGTLANKNMMFSVCLSLASADSSAACGASAASGSSAPDSPSARSSRSAARRDPSQPQH